MFPNFNNFADVFREDLNMKNLLLVLLFACQGAFAMTGIELMNKLQSKDPSIVLQAHSYVAGVTDSESTFLNQQKFIAANAKDKKLASPFFCAPEGTTTRKVVDVLTPKLEGESSTRQQSANVLIRRVLVETWPCSNNP
jgi:predicted ferric reductase